MKQVEEMDTVESVAQYLIDNEIRLATAESCTAGLIVAELGRIPGCGTCVVCGLGCYSPEAKQYYLGVEPETIEEHGLTSEETSQAMALGALRNEMVDLAVSNTGVAGPDDQDGIPAGTVCFAWVFRLADGTTRQFTETVRFHGDRNEVRLEASHYTLQRIPELHQTLLAQRAL